MTSIDIVFKHCPTLFHSRELFQKPRRKQSDEYNFLEYTLWNHLNIVSPNFNSQYSLYFKSSTLRGVGSVYHLKGLYQSINRKFVKNLTRSAILHSYLIYELYVTDLRFLILWIGIYISNYKKIVFRDARSNVAQGGQKIAST